MVYLRCINSNSNLAMIHHDTIKKYPGSLAELASDLGDLRYDALSEFLRLLAEKIERDGDKDLARGRKQLAAALHANAQQIRNSATPMDKAWVICEPYMK